MTRQSVEFKAVIIEEDTSNYANEPVCEINLTTIVDKKEETTFGRGDKFNDTSEVVI